MEIETVFGEYTKEFTVFLHHIGTQQGPESRRTHQVNGAFCAANPSIEKCAVILVLNLFPENGRLVDNTALKALQKTLDYGS